MRYDVSSTTAQEKDPFSHLSTRGSGRACAEVATACGRRTSEGPADAPTNGDRCRQTGTNSSLPRLPRRPKGSLVDLRVGNKPETFTGETHEWKGWSFKMRQQISAVDEELHVELVDVEANQLRELLTTGMNEAQKIRGRKLAFMLTMHMKDRALLMITKLSDPTNGFEIWTSGSQRTEDATRPC